MSTTDAELNEVVEEEGLAFMSGHSIGGGVGENSGSLSLPVSNAVGGVELSGRMGAANNEGKGRAGAGASSSVSSFFSFNWLGLQPLQKYFDVDTEEVSLRLKAALVRPYARDFLHARLGAERSGDLYGPFWLSATLVFVSTTFGNYARYMKSIQQNASLDEWYFDVDKVTTATSLFFGYYLAPVILHAYLSFSWRVSLGLSRLVCLYGYALTVFVPISVICVLPSDVVRWMSLIAAAACSSLFLIANLHAPLGEIYPRSTASSHLPVIALAVIPANLGLALLLKLFVFE